MLRRTLTAASLLLLLTIAGCDDNDSSPTDPTDEPPEDLVIVTESFEGVVLQLGTASHNFMVATPGPITFALTEISPLATITMGMGIGNPDTDDPSKCNQFASDTSVRAGQSLQATATSAAAYCVSVFDVGNIFADQEIAYKLTVTHP
jgi:hypothetical protein